MSSDNSGSDECRDGPHQAQWTTEGGASVSKQTTKIKHATPVLIRDVKRGQVKPDQRTIRALEAKIENDPRWRKP